MLYEHGEICYWLLFISIDFSTHFSSLFLLNGLGIKYLYKQANTLWIVIRRTSYYNSNINILKCKCNFSASVWSIKIHQRMQVLNEFGVQFNWWNNGGLTCNYKGLGDDTGTDARQPFGIEFDRKPTLLANRSHVLTVITELQKMHSFSYWTRVSVPWILKTNDSNGELIAL